MGRQKLRFVWLDSVLCTFETVSLIQILLRVLEIKQAGRRTDRHTGAFLPLRFYLIQFEDKMYKNLFQVPSP
jgi:hypothetical protein